MKLIERDERAKADECTQILPVAVPTVSGYMQQQYNERLIVLLAALCDKTPEQFVKESEASK